MGDSGLRIPQNFHAFLRHFSHVSTQFGANMPWNSMSKPSSSTLIYRAVRITWMILSHFDYHRAGLSPISSHVPDSDFVESRHICHFFDDKKCHALHLSHFWEECDDLVQKLFFFNLWRFLSHPLRKTSNFRPRRCKPFLNGKKCDDSAETEKYFFLPFSDLSVISEAWSGKANWAQTDPMFVDFARTPHRVFANNKPHTASCGIWHVSHLLFEKWNNTE